MTQNGDKRDKASDGDNDDIDALSELVMAAGILGEDRVGDPEQEHRLSAILGHYDADMRIHLTQRIVSDESLKPIKINRFCERHGLTGAEKKVVVSLCLGRSMAQHAKDHFISPNTARTHLQRVREKTGISRQANIVSTVLA